MLERAFSTLSSRRVDKNVAFDDYWDVYLGELSDLLSYRVVKT